MYLDKVFVAHSNICIVPKRKKGISMCFPIIRQKTSRIKKLRQISIKRSITTQSSITTGDTIKKRQCNYS